MQILLDMMQHGDPGVDVGDRIVPLVAGIEADKHMGLMFFFTQNELQQLLEFERVSELCLMSRTEQP